MMLLRITKVIAAIICLFVAYMAGGLSGERGAYHKQYIHEVDLISPILIEDPDFSNVEVREYSGGGVYLIGYVSSVEVLSRLRAKVAYLLGKPRSDDIVRAISIAP